MKKRLFAILLALTLALSLLPTAVFATEGEDTAGNPEEPAVQSDETGIAVQAAHTHCFCGGSITAGDHTDHNNVGSYKACKTWSELKNSWVGKNPVAYAYLENDITADNADKLYPYLSIQQGRTLYLCLNGHTLNLGNNYIWVGQAGATLYLCDCSAQKTGTVSGGSRGCVSVDDNSDNNATFNMYGGTLKGGNRTTGGGVDVVNSTMNMYGGTITENTATSDGGGIYVGTKSTLNLYGGTITKNTVSTNEKHHGGGVYVESNFKTGAGKISISGSPVITGNTRTYDNTTTTENLYLSYGFYNSGQFPTITLGTLTKGADIGISTGFCVFSTASETDYSEYFSSDDTGCHVEYNADKKLELKAGAAHVHSGGTANCHAKAVCEVCKQEYGTVDATKHDGGTEIKNAKAATCTEKGYTGDTYCKGCNAKLSDGKDIPAAGHKLKHVPAKNPTTFVAGNIEYWYCTVCGKYFRDAAATKEITKEATVTHKESAPIQGNKTVESSKTGDAGVMLYAGMAVLSLTGCAWLRRKEK